MIAEMQTQKNSMSQLQQLQNSIAIKTYILHNLTLFNPPSKIPMKKKKVKKKSPN
jgi:hypothetical protein